MCSYCTTEAFEEQIERTRQKMVDAAGEFGLNHPQVLYFSQELDRLHTCLLAKLARKRQVG